MNLGGLGGRRSVSPTSSRASSPVPRIARRTAEDGTIKNDKYLRRYAAIIERALTTWETAPEEWADYIAFLTRLLKAVQSHGQDTSTLPHNAEVASRLAQCLNPALPSGVHQRALEVYAYIFATFGKDHVSAHLTEYLPGLSTVLSFASLSVRPALYDILEKYILCLKQSELRSTLKALVLSLLPALEDETSEDFERALSILVKLKDKFASQSDEQQGTPGSSGYFWQCVFLSIITSPSRRLGALNFLVRHLPKFQNATDQTSHTSEAASAEAVLEPEPGLLIRCFACGLSDPQALIQRGFLDLLVTNLPLGSSVLQKRVRQEDLDRLTQATAAVLLKKDQNLNRRVFSWMLGPEPKDDGPASPTAGRRGSMPGNESRQLRYFSEYGKRSLVRCLLAMLSPKSVGPAAHARPYRICLSLMDRWEIGGVVVPDFFIPAVRSVFEYSQAYSREETAEVLKSASLFFDGVESRLIWTELFKLLRAALEVDRGTPGDLEFFLWITQHFSLKEEEMLTLHIPLVTGYLLEWLCEALSSRKSTESVLDILLSLFEILPPRALSTSPDLGQKVETERYQHSGMGHDVENFYRVDVPGSELAAPAFLADTSEIFVTKLSAITSKVLEASESTPFKEMQALLSLLPKLPGETRVPWSDILQALARRFNAVGDRTVEFEMLNMVISLLAAIASLPCGSTPDLREATLNLTPSMFKQLWEFLSPSSHRSHVEAARLIWQLDELTGPEDVVKATLNELMRYPAPGSQTTAGNHVEGVWRFATLWTHSMPSQTTTSKGDNRSNPRCGSAMPVTLGSPGWARRQDILTGPLFLALDILADTLDPARSVIRTLLSNHSSIALVFHVLLERMAMLWDDMSNSFEQHERTLARSRQQRSKELEYTMRHFEGVLGIADATIWQALGDCDLPVSSETQQDDSVLWIAIKCMEMLGERDTSPELNERSASILGHLLSGPFNIKVRLQALELDERLLSKIIASLSWQNAVVQSSLLRLAVSAMSLRHLQPPQVDDMAGRRSSTFNHRRKSSMARREDVAPALAFNRATTPSRLTETLRAGFASQHTRSQIDTWLDFLASSLPLLGQGLLSSLLPLVDTFARRIAATLAELQSIPTDPSAMPAFAPDNMVLKLLDGLNLILAEVHGQGVDEEDPEMPRNPSESSQNLLSNMTSGVFKNQVHQSKTSKANSRLTVIIAFKEAVRSCMRVWIWAAHSTGNNTGDRHTSATLFYNATRIRNRTRQMLEQIFNVELLESLEVVMAFWSQPSSAEEGREVLSLLHVMNVTRPQSVVPAILDALCSRTNASALSPSRQSSLTSDLTASDVVGYFTAYLESVDDDAMDEIWPDCTAFIRDVLANPLPFRQVLPALLWVTLVLAEKLSNTNFGDHKKMRRGLGDNFQRLLAASFTTSSHGSWVDTSSQGDSGGTETSLAVGRRTLNLVVILRHVTANIESLLETSDRITTVINSISANLISPAFHAKAFPATANADLLSLLARMTKKAPSAKSWKKDLSDAFGRPQLLQCSPDIMEQHWFPILRQWSMSDMERILDLLSRLTPPSSAGIMFGVGATAARLKADAETQFVLRRVCLLLLASPTDGSVAQLQPIEERLAELFEATPSSSPSLAIKAELFMLLRAVILTVSPVNLSSLWPLINDKLQAALASLIPQDLSSDEFTNLTLLQAGKLLDMLVAIAPDDFQLHEWLYITDTTDAVYHPPDWIPAALSDQLAEHLGSGGPEDSILPAPVLSSTDVSTVQQRPLFGADLAFDKEDIKAMPREDFAKAVMRPFLSQLSINSYESVYSMEPPILTAYRRSLLEDLMDPSTLVE